MWTLTRPHLVRALNCGCEKIDQLALLFSNLNKRDIYHFLQRFELKSRIARKSNEISWLSEISRFFIEIYIILYRSFESIGWPPGQTIAQRDIITLFEGLYCLPTVDFDRLRWFWKCWKDFKRILDRIEVWNIIKGKNRAPKVKWFYILCNH